MLTYGTEQSDKLTTECEIPRTSLRWHYVWFALRFLVRTYVNVNVSVFLEKLKIRYIFHT